MSRSKEEDKEFEKCRTAKITFSSEREEAEPFKKRWSRRELSGGIDAGFESVNPDLTGGRVILGELFEWREKIQKSVEKSFMTETRFGFIGACADQSEAVNRKRAKGQSIVKLHIGPAHTKDDISVW
jgi:hypothetical protein